MKYKLNISYDGTHYSGWQVQPNAISIQSLIQQALETALRTPTSLTGSGRTDAGVHALNQTAHFTAPKTDTRKLAHSLNGLLPPDIRIKQLEPVSDDFHARYSAKSKIYRYHLRTTQNPFTRLYSYHLPYPIDIPLLKKAAHHFIGEHDFTSFSNEAHRGSAAKNPVRNLMRLDVIESSEEIILEFQANGFLYKMVRNITGTLLDIARGKLPLDSLPEIFAAKDRQKAAAAAPAHGLFLVNVLY
ncbi:MAG: tRNA pseudouridine(38-40) synthase TruA [Simkaniaceae bacterium]|nr:tRNA pseudouridine(38-40) synthase TruA [Candidatus Sacchlamyda saccharinae]